MSVIRTLSASKSNEQRDREKSRLELEYRKSDKRLDGLITSNDEALKEVMQVSKYEEIGPQKIIMYFLSTCNSAQRTQKLDN